LWSVSMVKDLGGEVNPVGGGPAKLGWGYAWSPLVDDDHVICTPGGPKGLFAALDKKGKVVWRSKDVPEQATYASPVVATIGGVKQYIALYQEGVVGVSAKDGSLLWQHKRPEKYGDVVCNTPIVQGNKVYVTVGYNRDGAELLEINKAGGKFTVKSVYDNKIIGSRNGGVVLVGKHLYGFHETNYWACQDFATGKLTLPRKRQALKAGSLIAADGRLYVQGEAGEVAVLEANPKAFKLISKFQLPEKAKNPRSRAKVWTHPVISDGKLYLRDQEWLFCYQ